MCVEILLYIFCGIIAVKLKKSRTFLALFAAEYDKFCPVLQNALARGQTVPIILLWKTCGNHSLFKICFTAVAH